jgi:hypothetical protein
MALDLTMKITADASQAKRELASVEQGIARVETAARKGEPSVAAVARELGVYDNVTNRVVQSSAKLEETTRSLSSATAEQLYQQTRAALGMGEMEKRVTALQSSYEQAAVSSSNFNTAALAGGAAIAAFLAVGALELKFLYDSAKLYAERSGVLDDFNKQVDRVKGSWENMQYAVGAILLSNNHDIKSWADLAITSIDFVGSYIAEFVAKTMAGFSMLAAAWRSIPGIGGAAPTAPGAPGLFNGNPIGPISPPDIRAVEADLNAQRHALDHPARVRTTSPYSIPSIPYHLGITGAVPGVNIGGLQGPFDIPTIPYHLGVPSGIGGVGFQGGVSIPQGPEAGFFSNLFGGSFGGNLSNVILSAITGGGSMVKGVGSFVGSSIGSLFGKTITSGAGMAIGGIGGGVLNAVLPGIGALLGPLLGKLFGKLFGETQGHKDLMAANQQIGGIQSDLLSQYGSKENIAALGGGNVVAGWGSQNVAGLQAFSAEVDKFKAHANQAMNDMVHAALDGWHHDSSRDAADPGVDDQAGATHRGQRESLMGLPEKGVPSFKAIADAADELGVKVESLGTNIQNIKLGEQAESAAQAFETLRDAGADMGQVFAQSAPKMQEFVDRALKMGLALPDSIKPWLQQMVDAGLLVDDTGEKLKDLSSFNFTKPLEKSVEDLIGKLDELIVKLGGPVTDAIKNIPRNVDVNVNAHVRDDGSDNPDTNPDNYARGGVVYAARGWGRPRGTDTVRAWLTPGEIVLNAAQQKNVAHAMGGVNVAVHFNQPVMANDETQMAIFADFISRATISELTRRGIKLA